MKSDYYNTYHALRITHHEIMDEYFYNLTELIYKEVDSYLPVYKNNPCRECKICCTTLASQGLTSLEFDYMREYLIKNSRTDEEAENFRDYIDKLKNENLNQPLHLICPFYNLQAKGCSIYPARPLSCRTFGYFIKDERQYLIPEECYLKKNIKIYTKQTFSEIMPFAQPFYSLVYDYEKFRNDDKSSSKK
ncbi:MAG TPA: YkgJ family cysteine cluster protein [Candidatus Eremiobacteraeota bacterium]|nr:YkgJ family cysteine cluster protein [Candidatus Eremiobacteraeota bacterium]